MKKKSTIFYLGLLLLWSIQLPSQDKVNNQQSGCKSFLSSGTFIIGANYWASHAGPAMWIKKNIYRSNIIIK